MSDEDAITIIYKSISEMLLRETEILIYTLRMFQTKTKEFKQYMKKQALEQC